MVIRKQNTGRYYLAFRMAIFFPKWKITSVDEDAEKAEPSGFACECVKFYSTMKQFGGFSKS